MKEIELETDSHTDRQTHTTINPFEGKVEVPYTQYLPVLPVKDEPSFPIPFLV